MRASPGTSHWDDHAAQWNLLASPLRPHADDLASVRRALTGGGRALLLGVTPEYAGLFERVVAIDHNAPMIRAMWARESHGDTAVQGDWLQLPLREASFDACIGDGCLNLLACPWQYERLFGQLRRVLRPGGRLALRVFARPDAGETCDKVYEHALGAEIGNFHAFKLRLAMALAAESGNSNVDVAAIHQVFTRLVPDRSELAARSGWSAAQIATIDAYRNAAASYSFPTLAEVRASFRRDLNEIEVLHGGYELAERCPLFVLEART
jgi:ubiquinone/menaquinone biosynthesis C-methylase UbiE